jgi:hypothetical protein
MYQDYLERPVLEVLTTLNNGHPYVFPGLLHLADLHWLGARNQLLLACGLLFAIATATLLAVAVARAPGLATYERLALAGVPYVLVFWLAGYIRLGWGTAGTEGFLVTSSIACSLWAWIRAHEDDAGRIRWLAASLLAAVVATASTAAGIAVWPALLVAGLLLRLPPRRLLPAAMGLAVFALLLAAGHARRGTDVDVDPLWLLRVGASGLGSVVYHAASLGSRPHDGVVAERVAPVLGALAGVAFGVGLVFRIVRGPRPDRLEVFLLAMAMSGLVVAPMPGLVRRALFERSPGQVYASRYLLYTLLFWLPLLLLLGVRAARRGGACARLLPFAIAALCLALWPSHVRYADRLAREHDNMRVGELSVLVGVWDDALWGPYFPPRLGIRLAPDLLRERRLAMFRDGWHDLIGAPWSLQPRGDAGPGCALRVVDSRWVGDPRGTAARLAGAVRTVHSHREPVTLVAVDGDGRVRGLVRPALRGAPWRAGEARSYPFEGYVRVRRTSHAGPRFTGWRFYAVSENAVRPCVLSPPVAGSVPVRRGGP